MTFSVLQNLLDDQFTLDGAINFLKTKHKLIITEEILTGKRLIHVTRPQHPNDLDTIQDEASIILIDNNLKIISSSINRIYNITNTCGNIDISDKTYATPLTIEEWLPGTMVTVSKYMDEYLISTKESIMGSNFIGEHNTTCREVVLNILKEIFPIKGIATLFNESIFSNVNWVFNLESHKTGYTLTLISVIDLNNLTEFEASAISNIAEHFKLRTPKKFKAYSHEDIRHITKHIKDMNPNVRGVIILDCNNNRAKIKTRNNTQKTRLNYISYCLMKNDVIALSKQDSKYNEITKLMTKHFSKLIVELNNSYNKYSKIRTRKIFAEKIKNVPIPIAMFAMRDKKIDGFYQLYKVIRPSYLLKLIKETDVNKFDLILTNMKEG